MDIIYHPAEHEDPAPGRGSLPPRAWQHSDAAQLSLNAPYRFRFSRTAVVDDGDAFSKPDFNDTKWDTIPVPSHWVLHGYGAPAYQNIKFPFPLNPPLVPTENPTGDYRFAFDLPKDWALENGKVSEDVLGLTRYLVLTFRPC